MPLRLLLGVSGGIAAYKAAELIRLMRIAGADVRVVMTPAATDFVGPLTLQALSGNEVRTDLLDPRAEAGMGHIELARWADRVLVAPATADLIARLAAGFANDLLTTLILATAAPVAVAPAMNQRMWLHPATQANVELLRRRGVAILGPGEGSQACGESGPGRMLEPVEIMSRLGLSTGVELADRYVVITAGPTREALDPVRFIGNRSSGRMGYAVAAAFAARGARVLLVSGPTALRLLRNPDIVARVSSLPDRPFVVGFAAETERLEEHAREKLDSKGLDMIAANLVAGTAGGFEAEENALTVMWRDGRQSLPMMSKARLADALVALIGERYRAQVASQDP
jgi:phosphopantothenoylcysteine decarboxylase/phosphopantothenate--cysteine ligase